MAATRAELLASDEIITADPVEHFFAATQQKLAAEKEARQARFPWRLEAMISILLHATTHVKLDPSLSRPHRHGFV